MVGAALVGAEDAAQLSLQSREEALAAQWAAAPLVVAEELGLLLAEADEGACTIEYSAASGKSTLLPVRARRQVAPALADTGRGRFPTFPDAPGAAQRPRRGGLGGCGNPPKG